jgi:hypothetical protein
MTTCSALNYVLISLYKILHNNCKKLPEFAGIIYSNCYMGVISVKLLIKECTRTLTSFVALEMRSARRPRKMENQQLVAPSQQYFSIPVSFGQGLPSIQQRDNTGTSPILLTWLWLIFGCSLEWNQHWRDGAFVTILTSLKTGRKSWKGFIKWLPGIFPSPIQSAAEVYSSTRRMFWSKCSLNNRISEMKWYGLHFEDTAYKNA